MAEGGLVALDGRLGLCQVGGERDPHSLCIGQPAIKVHAVGREFPQVNVAAAIGSTAVPEMMKRGYSVKIAAGSVVTAGARCADMHRSRTCKIKARIFQLRLTQVAEIHDCLLSAKCSEAAGGE